MSTKKLATLILKNPHLRNKFATLVVAGSAGTSAGTAIALLVALAEKGEEVFLENFTNLTAIKRKENVTGTTDPEVIVREILAMMTNTTYEGNEGEDDLGGLNIHVVALASCTSSVLIVVVSLNIYCICRRKYYFD
jgi:hypothetical protein